MILNISENNTTCIITFGKSDLQFERSKIENYLIQVNNEIKLKLDNIEIELSKNREHYNFFLIRFPRIDGKLIIDNFQKFKDFILFPLIEPVIDLWLQENRTIENFVFVVTNQNDVDQQFSFSDTIYYGKIFKEYIKNKYDCFKNSEFKEIEITKNVTDIDFQYKHFSKIIKNQIPESKKILLIPQGGIDQINQALTLQLILHFGDKVNIYQKPENSQPIELKFTKLFLKELSKKQIVALIKTLNYKAAAEIADCFVEKEWNFLKNICMFADFRSKFLFHDACKIKNYLGKNIPDFIENYENLITPEADVKNFFDKYYFYLIERFYIAEYYFYIKNYTDFVLSFQIFLEFLVNSFLSNKEIDLVKGGYTAAEKLFSNIKAENPKIFEEIKKIINKKEEEVKVSFPSLVSLAFIESKNDDVLKKLFEPIFELNSQLNNSSGSRGLDTLRNKVAHKGQGIKEIDLVNTLKSHHKCKSIDIWQEILNHYKKLFNLSQNPYYEINEYIENLL